MADTIYVLNDDTENCVLDYLDHGDLARREFLQSRWQFFDRTDPARHETYRMLLRQTNAVAEVMVDHRLPLAASPGWYRVETFIPGRHATTRRAIFSIAHLLHPTEIGGWHLDERMVVVNMHDLYDVWHSLGEFYLEIGRHPEIGRVRQFDLTRENPPEEISFGPVRWVPLDARVQTHRFDSPVGALEDRQGAFPSGQFIFGCYPLWAGEWFDANPFLNWYTYGYHTGADLNLPGSSGADKGEPVYVIGDGMVTYAGRAGSWGNIVVVEHPEAWVRRSDGQMECQEVYSRYGHVDAKILVRTGEAVSRGQQIGSIGLAAGANSGWHLHFDVSHTDVLRKRPAYWPDLGALRTQYSGKSSRSYQNAQSAILRQVTSHFMDPLQFIQDNHR